MNIICRSTLKDQFGNQFSEKENLFLTFFEEDTREGLVSSHIKDVLKGYLANTPEVIKDLLNIGQIIYCADQLVSRKTFGFDNWSRDFSVYLPVFEPDLWNEAKNNFESGLNFLTGDHWNLHFRPRNAKKYKEKPSTQLPSIDAACLFSGGMDSFLGANKLISEGKKLALVSHYKKGANEKETQNSLLNSLRKEYSTVPIEHFQFYIQPNQKASTFEKENSSRVRSFLFLSLGIATAHIHGNEVPLYLPENGFISLNIPLIPARMGALSTRTTHPYFLDKFKSALSKVGVQNKIVNEYQYSTKGQMILQAPNRKFADKFVIQTQSCSAPDKARWKKFPPGTHCGFCTPCIIRRAALKAASLENLESYVENDLKSNKHPYKAPAKNAKAFKKAILSTNRKPNGIIFKILESGPLPQGQLEKYKEMYIQGINELSNLLN